jgi:hypothetical protein
MLVFLGDSSTELETTCLLCNILFNPFKVTRADETRHLDFDTGTDHILVCGILRGESTSTNESQKIRFPILLLPNKLT